MARGCRWRCVPISRLRLRGCQATSGPNFRNFRNRRQTELQCAGAGAGAGQVRPGQGPRQVILLFVISETYTCHLFYFALHVRPRPCPGSHLLTSRPSLLRGAVLADVAQALARLARAHVLAAVRLLSPMHRLSPITLIASDFFESASARSNALIAIKGPSIGCR